MFHEISRIIRAAPRPPRRYTAALAQLVTRLREFLRIFKFLASLRRLVLSTSSEPQWLLTQSLWPSHAGIRAW